VKPVGGLFFLVVGGSLALALLLAIVAVPVQYVWLRPEAVCLVVLYWALYTPQHIGLGTAWVAGLLQDVVEGCVWGAHALALCLVAYIAQVSYQRLCAYSIGQQCFWVFVLVGIHQLFVNWMQGLEGFAGPIDLVMLPTIISALCWPLVAMLLHKARRAYHGA
jgi:rod shape-determining protein MreD